MKVLMKGLMELIFIFYQMLLLNRNLLRMLFSRIKINLIMLINASININSKKLRELDLFVGGLL